MLTRSEARALVERRLRALDRDGLDLVILDEHTVDRPWGWVFFYNSRRFVETNDILWALGGNAPYLVDAETGELHETGTAHGVEHYIAEYERTRAPRRTP